MSNFKKNSPTKIHCKTIEHVSQAWEYQMHTEIMRHGWREGEPFVLMELVVTNTVALLKYLLC